MDFQSLRQQLDVREFSPPDLALPSLPESGSWLLRDVARRFPSELAAFARQDHFSENLELSSYPAGSSSWYGDRRIRFLLWMGDLVIDGDLIDDDFQTLPLLVVHGNLTVRHWLRGGMPSFVGGSVQASGFIVGHYNDSALFIGGDLSAAGYAPRAKPYPDLPTMAPHQMAGRMNAKHLNVLNASDQELRASFVDAVLCQDDDGTWLDEQAIFERSNAGLPVWRSTASHPNRH